MSQSCKLSILSFSQEKINKLSKRAGSQCSTLNFFTRENKLIDQELKASQEEINQVSQRLLNEVLSSPEEINQVSAVSSQLIASLKRIYTN